MSCVEILFYLVSQIYSCMTSDYRHEYIFFIINNTLYYLKLLSHIFTLPYSVHILFFNICCVHIGIVPNSVPTAVFNFREWMVWKPYCAFMLELAFDFFYLSFFSFSFLFSCSQPEFNIINFTDEIFTNGKFLSGCLGGQWQARNLQRLRNSAFMFFFCLCFVMLLCGPISFNSIWSLGFKV